MSTTTTKTNTVRDMFNANTLGLLSDAMLKAPLGDILSVLLDAANPNVVVAATTVGAVAAQTGATVATADATDLASAEALANALKTDYNKSITDIATLVARVNQLRVDVLALRAELAAGLAGTVGGATETGVSVTSNAATLAAAASSIITVRATAGTTQGVKKLIRDPSHTLATGEVFWDGKTGLTFAAVDAVTTIDVVYSKADLSQKASCLLATMPV